MDLINTIKDNKILFFALILFIGLFLFFLFRSGTTNQDSKPAGVISLDGTKESESILKNAVENPNVKNQQYEKVSFNLNPTTFDKKTADVYKYISSNLYTKENLLNLVKALKMEVIKTSQSPVQGEVILAKGTNSLITIESDLKRFDLVYETPAIPEGLNFKDKNVDEYIQTARNKLVEIGFSLDRYSNITYAFQKNGPNRRYIVNYAEAADVIQVIFSASIDGKPFVDNKESLETNKISVLIDVNKNFMQIYGEDVGQKGEVLRTVDLKTFEQVREELFQNKAKLINADFIVTGDISTITIKDIKLGYYVLGEEIIPVYFVKGLTRASDGYSGDVDLLLPAEVNKN